MEIIDLLLKLKHEMSVQGITQKDISDALKMKPTTVHNMLKGATEMELSTLFRIIKLLKIDIKSLICEGSGEVREQSPQYGNINIYEHLQNEVLFLRKLLLNDKNNDSKNNDATLAHFVRDSIQGAIEKGQPD